MDYSLCKPLQTFLKMYPTMHVSVILQLHKDLTSFESTELYDIDSLQIKKLDYLRDLAKKYRIKYYTKLNKQQIIQAILQKQNSLSDTSSNSSESDTELKIQPKKEEITQIVQKEENPIVYESENTETEEEEQNTETEEEEQNTPETIENTQDLQKYDNGYVAGIQDVQLLQNIIQYLESLPRSMFQRSRNERKQQYEADLQALLSKPKPKKHKYTKSETEKLLTPEEIAILETVATTSSAKLKRVNLHAKKRRLKMKLNNEQKQSSEEEESNESS
jgi:hypothetical protein